MMVKLLSHDWLYHGPHSGYERLVQAMPDASVIRPVYFPFRISALFAQRTQHGHYSPLSFRRELSAAIDMAVHKPDILHVLYGDVDFHYLAYLKWLSPSTRFVVTFHHPPGELARRLEKVNKGIMKSLSRAVCVGKNQVPYLETLVGAGKARWIPHGIDTSFFSPDETKRDEQHILVVGVSHRDMMTLSKSLEALKVKFPDLRCTAIAHEGLHKQIEGLRWVDARHENIEEGELLGLYRGVTCVLLLMNDCTASNNVLESIATGCPLVVTDVGGVRDYVDPSCAVMVNRGDVGGVVNAVGQLIEDKAFALRISSGARKCAEKFSWQNIVELLKGVYQEVLTHE